jgi:hypothetical protein
MNGSSPAQRPEIGGQGAEKGARRSGWCLALLLVLLCSSECGVGLGAESVAPSEHQVKAAILFNLAKYVEWPAERLPAPESPILLGILGEDNFGDDFKRMVEGKTINGRKLVLKRMSPGEEMKSLHLLFIAAAERKRVPQVLDQLRECSVLTVGETDDFAQLGGMVQLAMKDSRIRPQVNLKAAERVSLKISSRLLSISDVLKGQSAERPQR